MRLFKQMALTVLFVSCSLIPEDEEEEFYFYEPVFSEAYQVVTDTENMVEYEYQIHKDLIVETEDTMGYKYKLEIPALSLAPGMETSFAGLIMPLTGIQNLPSGIEFKFGLEVEPMGMAFSKPVTITIELPGDFNTDDLMGFYSPGEWTNPYLEPVKIKKSSGKTEAIFSVTHFSSYGGMTVEDGMFECPDYRSAQVCSDLREIIACKLGHYVAGINDELTGEDKIAINDILYKYMDRQLKYLEEEPPDYSYIYLFEEDLTEYLCWAAMTQEFNNNPESVFGDLYSRAKTIIKNVLSEHAMDMEDACLQSREVNECGGGTQWFTLQTYVLWLEIAQQLGLDLDMKDIYEFCDGAVNESFHTLTLVNPLTQNEYYHPHGDSEWYKIYQIELSSPDDTLSFKFMMNNAIGETVEVEETEFEWEEDYVPYYLENVFIYSDGKLWINKNQETVKEALNCNPNEDVCMDYFHSGFSVMRNECDIAYVKIIWYRR